jgi:pSer/pThr/pTyr-binding forkhead associated (FHA) protein
MAKRHLFIDGDDQGHFFLSVERGTLTIGVDPKNAEAVLRGLHISRIHCEIEVEEDLVVVGSPETTTGASTAKPPFRQELHTGQALQVGHAHLRLEGARAAPSTETGAVAAPKAAPTPGRLIKRLFVIDGADQGRSFPLPDSGTLTIGKSHKCSDIVLHDLFVSRVHCQLQIEGDKVVVMHMEGDNGTLINGQRITEQELRLGEVLRVGNEHLRLETAVVEDSPASKTEKDTGTISIAGEEDVIEVVEEEDGIEVVEEDYGLEVIEEEDGVEVIEEETEVLTAEPAEEPAEPSEDPYCLPHPSVDQLVALENQVLGRYQIGPLLGRGQSSLVFRAQDLKTNQRVALKVLSPDFPSSDAELQRFVRALKVTPTLPHPHLVTIHGAGKSGTYCWIAREYVEGESLTRLIQRLNAAGKLEWTFACRVAIQLGKALHFLHQHRVTHGNITPRNILIRHSDKLTKLADLMLNRALDGSRLQKAILGKKLLAELPYLAPEQTDPHASVSPLADLYALGTVLYALLTGRPPFLGASPKEVLTLIREGKVVKPSKLQPGIPPSFERAVLKMMARRPEERFQTAEEMLAVVEPIAEENGIKM